MITTHTRPCPQRHGAEAWEQPRTRGLLSPSVSASNYAPGMMLSSPLAPALAHRRASSLMVLEISESEGVARSKMHALRCL